MLYYPIQDPTIDWKQMNEKTFVDTVRLWHAENYSELEKTAVNAGLTGEEYLLRVLNSAVSEVLVVGDLTLEINTTTCFCNNEEITLTRAEFDVLTVLMRNCHRLTDIDSLHQAANWKRSEGSRGLSFLIYKLRQKTEASKTQIITVRGRGYRLHSET